MIGVVNVLDGEMGLWWMFGLDRYVLDLLIDGLGCDWLLDMVMIKLWLICCWMYCMLVLLDVLMCDYGVGVGNIECIIFYVFDGFLCDFMQVWFVIMVDVQFLLFYVIVVML